MKWLEMSEGYLNTFEAPHFQVSTHKREKRRARCRCRELNPKLRCVETVRFPDTAGSVSLLFQKIALHVTTENRLLTHLSTLSGAE